MAHLYLDPHLCSFHFRSTALSTPNLSAQVVREGHITLYQMCTSQSQSYETAM